MTASGDEVRPGWVLNDGVLHREQPAGDIISKKTYEYFVLEFDWKIVEGCNSGVKYRYRKFGKRWLGCEYQILDDERSQETNPKNQTGSLYDVYAPDASKRLKPAGEFNHTKIVVFGNRIEHWLNDQRILVVYSGTNDWRKHIAESKFNDVRGFGENRCGRLMFQDHGGEIWFQNVTIQEYRQVECRPRLFR